MIVTINEAAENDSDSVLFQKFDFQGTDNVSKKKTSYLVSGFIYAVYVFKAAIAHIDRADEGRLSHESLVRGPLMKVHFSEY